MGTVRYTPYTFALGARITEESVEDEMYGIVPKIGAELGAAAQYEIEIQAFKVLTMGLAYWSRYGIQPHRTNCRVSFKIDHAIARGGSYPNRPATATDLSQAAIEEALTNFRLIVNESGLPMPKTGKKLIVPPQLEWVAKRLLLSEYEPDSANNAINTVNKALKYEITHYLTDPGQWVVTADMHDLNVWVRRGIRTQTDPDFNHGGVKTKVSFRIGTGHSGWRGAYSSPGS